MKPELLITLLNGKVFQVVVLLHVFQQILDIGVLFVTEAAVLLHLQMDALDMDLRWRENRLEKIAKAQSGSV